MYPLGGQTSLYFGLPAKVEGVGLSTVELNNVIDFPARDMTVTVEAGITMSKLAETLAVERLRLPVDVPQSSTATLGGVVATNFNGPRRYGTGTIRDYVIGISAIDGTGTPFKGGGRVVKNVAGYDFCKLLTGSMGTLGVISKLTLKLTPIPASFRILTCTPNSLENAESLLGELVRSNVTPSAVELVSGTRWTDQLQGSASDLHLVVALEGTELETAWMSVQLAKEWRESGIRFVEEFTGESADSLWTQL
ncbi:MAG: glycolate oxidase FAD binding subunit, partial [Pirellulaceae bacterium]